MFRVFKFVILAIPLSSLAGAQSGYRVITAGDGVDNQNFQGRDHFRALQVFLRVSVSPW